MTTNVINRAQAESLLAKQSVKEIIQEATKTSAALQTFRHITMTAGTTVLPVLAALPTSGFVTNTDATASTATLDRQALNTDDIPVVVPIHENTLANSNFDIWAEIKPCVAEEFGRVLDQAVFFGVNKPATWTSQAIIPGAVAAGNVIYEDTNPGDLAEDINQCWAKVEEDGFDVNINYAGRALRARLRGLRDKQDNPIYLDSLRIDNRAAAVYGEPIHYVTNGAWEKTQATLVAGDANKAILGIRKDMEFKILDQATIGGLNLAERNMLALRAVIHVAYATVVPVTRESGTTGWPFAVVKPGNQA